MKTIKHFPEAQFPFAIVDSAGAVSSAYKKESDAIAALEHINEGQRNDENDAKLTGKKF